MTDVAHVTMEFVFVTDLADIGRQLKAAPSISKNKAKYLAFVYVSQIKRAKQKLKRKLRSGGKP